MDAILDLLENDCLTTDRIAALVGLSESDARDTLKRMARDGMVNLVSYGWNFKLAWSCIPLDEFVSDPSDPSPWDMSDYDRKLELS